MQLPAKLQTGCMDIMVSPMLARVCVTQPFQFGKQLVNVVCRSETDVNFTESDEMSTHSGHSRREAPADDRIVLPH